MGPNSSTLDPSHVDLGSISTSLMGKISVKQNSWTQSSPTVSSASLRKCAVNLIKFPQSSSGRSELTKTLIIQKVTSQGFRLHEKSATSKSTYISKRSKQHTVNNSPNPKSVGLRPFFWELQEIPPTLNDKIRPPELGDKHLKVPMGRVPVELSPIYSIWIPLQMTSSFRKLPRKSTKSWSKLQVWLNDYKVSARIKTMQL